MTRSLESTWLRHGGYIMRSRAETRVARMLEQLDIEYLYEHMPYDFRGYLPDFYLPALDAFIEVKGAEPTAAEIAKCERLHEHTRCPVMIVHGRPSTFMHHDRDDGYVRPEVSWTPKILIAGHWGPLVVNLVCRAVYRSAGRIAGERFVSALSNDGADRLQTVWPSAVHLIHEMSAKAGRPCRVIYDNNDPVNAEKLAMPARKLSPAERECKAFIERQLAMRAAA